MLEKLPLFLFSADLFSWNWLDPDLGPGEESPALGTVKLCEETGRFIWVDLQHCTYMCRDVFKLEIQAFQANLELKIKLFWAPEVLSELE